MRSLTSPDSILGHSPGWRPVHLARPTTRIPSEHLGGSSLSLVPSCKLWNLARQEPRGNTGNTSLAKFSLHPLPHFIRRNMRQREGSSFVASGRKTGFPLTSHTHLQVDDFADTSSKLKSSTGSQ